MNIWRLSVAPKDPRDLVVRAAGLTRRPGSLPPDHSLVSHWTVESVPPLRESVCGEPSVANHTPSGGDLVCIHTHTHTHTHSIYSLLLLLGLIPTCVPKPLVTLLSRCVSLAEMQRASSGTLEQ